MKLTAVLAGTTNTTPTVKAVEIDPAIASELTQAYNAWKSEGDKYVMVAEFDTAEEMKNQMAQIRYWVQSNALVYQGVKGQRPSELSARFRIRDAYTDAELAEKAAKDAAKAEKSAATRAAKAAAAAITAPVETA